MGDEFSHIKADAACAHDGDTLADRAAAQDDVYIADGLGMIDAFQNRTSRLDAGRQDNLVKAARFQQRRFNLGVKMELYPTDLDHLSEIAQRLGELLLARNASCEVELPTDL